MHLVKAAAGGPVGLLLVHLSISPSRLTKLSQLVELFESPSLRNRPISRITQHQRAVFVSLKKKKRKKEEEKIHLQETRASSIASIFPQFPLERSRSAPT